MSLKPIIQPEVSHRDNYCLLMHAYGIQKDGTDEPYLQDNSGNSDKVNRLVDIVREEDVGQIKKTAWKHIYYHM